jgi:hypothetical protein
MSTIKIQKNEEGFTIYEEISEITEEQYKVLEKLVEKHKAKEQEKKGLWRPEKESYYWILNDDSRPEEMIANYSGTTQRNIESGNCFHTKSEAQAELGRRKALTRIKDYIAREGIEREKDWFYGDIIYDSLRMLGFSAEVTEKIIQACSSDLKILFGI